MGMHHRKLIPEICGSICHVEEDCSSDCKVCLKLCLTHPPYYSPPTQPPPFFSDDEKAHQGNHRIISTYLILTLALLASIFLIVSFLAIIYTRFLSSRRRRRRRGVLLSSRQQQTQDTHDDDFVDEEHGPVVDHPIWYIRTPGLQESIISAITVCKYKKGEGLIEGTDCAVCLSEFIEDESLRVLPKCHHAFHLPCIDTWLRSHTNCPLCRAPIVANPQKIPSLDPTVSNSLENSQMENLEIMGETSGGMENRVEEDDDEAPEVEGGTSQVQEVVCTRPRRSVSLDSSSVANINLALASVLLSVESESDSNRVVLGDNNGLSFSKRVFGNGNLPIATKGSSSSFRTRYLPSVPSSMKRSHSYNGKYFLSWYNWSQKKPNGPS